MDKNEINIEKKIEDMKHDIKQLMKMKNEYITSNQKIEELSHKIEKIEITNENVLKITTKEFDKSIDKDKNAKNEE